jgi:L-malate glycosyltransferase
MPKMRINFIVPGYVSGPSGGVRVIYEYANQLVSRGHEVTVVHPRRLRNVPRVTRPTLREWAREGVNDLANLVLPHPQINWHKVDSRVKLLYVPNSQASNVPDGDVVFATGWMTVQSVLDYPETKGAKCYFIQGYESYQASKELVDATWRAPLCKVVVAKWLVDLGKDLGCSDLTCIPNAIDHKRFRLKRPIADRPRQVSMVFSTVQIKGASDGLEALKIVRKTYPDLKVVMFGLSPAQSWIPEWAEYHRNPSQEFIVDSIYNKSQIFIGTSWMEGFSLPPAEAAACGCAIVTTDSMGVREFIGHGETGLLSPPKNPQALAANICRLLEDESFRVQLAKAANRIVSGLSWERSADLFEQFILGASRKELRVHAEH